MNKQEFEDAIARIEAEAESNKIQLSQEYAFSNNSVKIGDKIKDHYQYIEVHQIKCAVYNGYSSRANPQCVYIGKLLKKNGEPRKDGAIGRIFQHNLEQTND